jgi:hypothetical protein
MTSAVSLIVSNPHIGAIVGGVIGGLVALAASITLIMFVARRRLPGESSQDVVAPSHNVAIGNAKEASEYAVVTIDACKLTCLRPSIDAIAMLR